MAKEPSRDRQNVCVCSQERAGTSTVTKQRDRESLELPSWGVGEGQVQAACVDQSPEVRGAAQAQSLPAEGKPQVLAQWFYHTGF